jgi:hypothetical protein
VSLIRYFLVHALKAGKLNDVRSFFAEFGDMLMSGPDAKEWSAWFALPYVNSPANHPSFQVRQHQLSQGLSNEPLNMLTGKASGDFPVHGKSFGAQVYFTKEWAQLVETSFRNLLAEVIQKLPLPAVLRFDTDRRQRLSLQRQCRQLQKEKAQLEKVQQPSHLTCAPGM